MFLTKPGSVHKMVAALVIACLGLGCTNVADELVERRLQSGVIVQHQTSCERDSSWNSLPVVEANDHTIDQRAVPNFLIRADNLSQEELLIIVFKPGISDECSTYDSFRIIGSTSGQVKLIPVLNWKSVADDQAIAALEKEMARCGAMSEALALEAYGRGAIRTENGSILEASDGFSGCLAPILSNSYSLLIETAGEEILITSVFGRILF